VTHGTRAGTARCRTGRVAWGLPQPDAAEPREQRGQQREARRQAGRRGPEAGRGGRAAALFAGRSACPWHTRPARRRIESGGKRAAAERESAGFDATRERGGTEASKRAQMRVIECVLSGSSSL
jgi:hypothetical protein